MTAAPLYKPFTANDISSWRVMIVDDEIDNLGVAQKVLTYNKADVEAIQDSTQVLARLDKICPNVILLDLSMPQIDGWELLKMIRAEAKWQHIPVISVTAHAMAGVKEEVLEAGFDGYISKPFRILTFLDAIKSILLDLQSNQHGKVNS